MNTHVLQTPIGPVRLVANDHALCAIELNAGGPPDTTEHPILAEAARQLRAYFEGHTTTFDVPLELEGTPFQRAVWRALLDIPFGETRSYAQIAEAIGRPSACRAVGAANGRNPVAIIVPCHRVIGADGTLTGYGGGLPAKRWLLRHEGSRAQPSLPGT